MKTNRYILKALGFILLCGFGSCLNQSDKSIANSKDYNVYLENEQNFNLEFAKSEISFWQAKFDKAPNQFSYLSQISANYSKLFEITGNVSFLLKAENLLKKSNEAFRYTGAGAIRSLSRNYISQHRFREALSLANKALAIGDDRKETQKLLFDVQMELGNYSEASQNLNAIKDWKDYDYLIRLAKWNDHQGNLDKAIDYMEKAAIIAEQNNNKGLMIWSYSNIGDMMGHAGRIDDSYHYYLKTLKLDNNNTYALKGIAWIAFSHDRNMAEANRIIDKILKKHKSPDFYLLKSDIAKYEKKVNLQKKNMDYYFKMLSENHYGVMYNKYNALIFAQQKEKVEESLAIAQQEIKNRPTPDSYDLLAWAYFNEGNNRKALEIAQKYVENKSFEPKVSYHLACIYKANHQTNKLIPIKEELQKSEFELGPNLAKEIENL